jgi:hypothetical protein
MVTAMSAHLAAFLIAAPVQGRQHATGEPGGLVKDGFNHVGRRFLITGQSGDLVQAGQLGQYEHHVLQRGNIGTHGFTPDLLVQEIASVVEAPTQRGK